MDPLRIKGSARIYDAMIGVGGIGTGSFFQLRGNHTLGREESRGGRFLRRNDYCKLHIVSHYVQTLMGSGFATIPVGMVGDDATGRQLLEEMRDAGLHMRRIDIAQDVQTLFSFCFVYPDGSGGNLTTVDSACSLVTPEYVQEAIGEFQKYLGRGIALAVPEVELAARRRLLELGGEHSFFRAASFSSGEIAQAQKLGYIPLIDLLALNLDEARMLCQEHEKNTLAESIVERTVTVIQNLSPKTWITVTAGVQGSWAWNGERLRHFGAPSVEAVSTAGAGDAFLAGVLCGLAAGLLLFEAQEFGTLVGSFSVLSPHTIHKGISRSGLQEFVKKSGCVVSESVMNLLAS